jgi:hypothetical protein
MHSPTIWLRVTDHWHKYVEIRNVGQIAWMRIGCHTYTRYVRIIVGWRCGHATPIKGIFAPVGSYRTESVRLYQNVVVARATKYQLVMTKVHRRHTDKSESTVRSFRHAAVWCLGSGLGHPENDHQDMQFWCAVWEPDTEPPPEHGLSDGINDLNKSIWLQLSIVTCFFPKGIDILSTEFARFQWISCIVEEKASVIIARGLYLSCG